MNHKLYFWSGCASIISAAGVGLGFLWLIFFSNSDQLAFGLQPMQIKVLFVWFMIGMFYLWLSMIVDYLVFERSSYRVLKGVLVIFGAHVGAIIYFVFVFMPRFVERLKERV